MSEPSDNGHGPKAGLAESSFQWGKNKPDPRPVYRVVELVRDADGRVRKKGNIWHLDPDVPRKFGRAMAANTSSHRILIEDNQGRVLEEVQITSAGDRKASWSNWEDIPLPKLPARKPGPPKNLPVLAPPRFDQDDEDDENDLAAAVAESDRDCDVSV